MSKPREFEIICDRCKHTENFHAWDSINVDLDPKMKDKILSEEIFHWVCPKCGAKHYIDYCFLYHDMKNKCMIQFDPRENLENTNKIEMPPMPALFHLDGYQFRIVYGLQNLKEKIFILDAGLDDRIIEFLKYISIDTIKETNKDTDRIFFAYSESNRLCFVMRKEDGTIDDQMIGIDSDLYEEVKMELQNMGLLQDDGNFINVDLDWVTKLNNDGQN